MRDWLSAGNSTSCSVCDVGKASSKGAAECVKCSEGRYSSVAGQEECEKCAPGTYNTIEAALECEVRGRTSPLLVLDTDIFSQLCPVGKYQSGLGSADCLVCDEGSIAPENGSLTCTE